MKYRKKPVVIEAVQWFKMGDHPAVKQYASMTTPRKFCSQCHHSWQEHGDVDTLEGLHIVCPGDWIITGIVGEHYPCKPDVFELTYEPVEG